MMPFNSEKGSADTRRLQNKADPAINNRVQVSAAIGKYGWKSQALTRARSVV